MRQLYKFHWDCGRMGALDGLFIADGADVADLCGKEIYFGEVLGKHSEIYGTLKPDHVQPISSDPVVVDALSRAVGRDTISGYNPFEYFDEEAYEED